MRKDERTYSLIWLLVATLILNILISPGLPVLAEDLPAVSFRLQIQGQPDSYFTECTGIGSETELIDQSVADPATGQNVIRKIPGELTWNNMILKRKISTDTAMWEWREQVEEGNIAAACRDVVVATYYQGRQVGQWNLKNAWPSRIVCGTDQSGDMNEEIELVFEKVEALQVQVDPVSITVAKTDVTSSSAGDGSITVTAAGGGGTCEYSIDNGTTWQDANTFIGLSAGTYAALARDKADPSNVSIVSTVTIESSVTIIVNILPVNNAEVAYGINEEEAIDALPATATIEDSDGQTHMVNLNWSIENYDGSNPGTYNAVGNFELPDGVEQSTPPSELKVTASVKVRVPVNPSISPDNFNFDLHEPADITTAITWNDAQSITGVVYEGVSLAGGTGFTLAGNTLTIKQEYITGLNLAQGSSAEFTLSFDVGDNILLTVTMVNNYVPGNDASLSDLSLNGMTLTDFVSDNYHYTVELPHNTQPGSEAATVSAVLNDPNAGMVITQASTLPGSGTVEVTAENSTTTQIYTVHFTLGAAPNSPPTAKVPVPVQVAMTGSHAQFDASHIARDSDNDPLTITQIVITPDPGAATAALDDGAVTVTGVAPGSTSVEVSVSDGTDSMAVIVPIEVTEARTPTYTVTFNSQGGRAVTSLNNVTSGSAISTPPAPTLASYNFGGWYKESSCTNAWNFSTDTVTTNVTLYAKWTANSPTTTYALNTTAGTGGTITAGSSGNYAAGTVINLKAAANSNYSFNGWTSSNGGTFANVNSASTTFTMPAGATALTATFAYNGGGGGSSSGGGGSTGGGTTVTGRVINDNGTQVSNVTATVSTDSHGNYTVSMKAAQNVILKQPDRTMSSLSDLSKVTFATVAGSPVTVSADGIINLTNLAKGSENHFNIMYDLGNGQSITIATMDVKVSSSGKVSLTCTLIDPYGVIIDAVTGLPVAGANVTLYYANTDRNKTNGKTPDTVVPLPGIDGFKPNNNLNPQLSDASGAYGFMVFPTTDYYIVANKEGYNNYTSPTIAVEQDIVKWDFKMNQHTSGVTRIAGPTSVDTALAIAKASYTGKVANVILAAADNYPDALAGSVLAYKLDAPVLLVGSSDADQGKVLAYMKDNMNPAGTVYILGGTAVVSSALEGKVTASGFANITRLGGIDKYETSVKIADQLKVQTGTPIVLTYGENYPDALSISCMAAKMQYPILLVQKDRLSDAVKNEIAAIKPTKVYIIGGQGVISTTVESQVAHITSLDKENIVRIAGVDRYETSIAVAQYFNLSGQSVCIATGNNFPDALAGSVYASNHNAAIILADGELSDQAMNYLKGKKLTGAILFGGEVVVSKNIEQQLGQLIGK